MKISRRGFLKFAAFSGTAAAVGAPKAAKASVHTAEAKGLLIDTTRCVGCRGCEVACSEANKLPEPPSLGDKSVLEKRRATTTTAYTVVNKVEGGKATRFAKTQCMHCLEPACASACPARALDKQPEGPVIYRPERCLGCRYCMMACPFEVPRFEYDSNAPLIRKCEMCFSRQKDGQGPACASVCPSGAVTFGKRADLLEDAKQRIYTNPGKYLPHVYGEHEAGGTSVLYLADASFEKLGLKSGLGDRSWPDLTKGALGLVPFIVTLWPPLLMGIHTFSKSRGEKAQEPEKKEAPHV